jgi:hypothetical protein
MAASVAIPSLDAIAVDAALADGLPTEVLAALMQRCAIVVTTLAAQQAAQARAQSLAATSAADRTLNADEIAAALGTNRRWVFRNARRLPFVRRVSRKCVVGSEAGLRRWREVQKT